MGSAYYGIYSTVGAFDLVWYHTLKYTNNNILYITILSMITQQESQVSYREVLLRTSCKEDLSLKRHLAVTNVSSHWYLFTQWSMIKDLKTF